MPDTIAQNIDKARNIRASHMENQAVARADDFQIVAPRHFGQCMSDFATPSESGERPKGKGSPRTGRSECDVS